MLREAPAQITPRKAACTLGASIPQTEGAGSELQGGNEDRMTKEQVADNKDPVCCCLIIIHCLLTVSLLGNLMLNYGVTCRGIALGSKSRLDGI